MSLNQEQIIESVATMSVLELSELIKKFETKFGVSAAAPRQCRPGAGSRP